MVKILKRENKQLQLKQQQNNQQDLKQTKDSDSDAPPWERRKLESRLSDIEKMILEKNSHIEQLLRDCRTLEHENQECSNKIQELTQQLSECTQQLQIATQNYETLEETYKGILSTLFWSHQLLNMIKFYRKNSTIGIRN